MTSVNIKIRQRQDQAGTLLNYTHIHSRIISLHNNIGKTTLKLKLTPPPHYRNALSVTKIVVLHRLTLIFFRNGIRLYSSLSVGSVNQLLIGIPLDSYSKNMYIKLK